MPDVGMYGQDVPGFWYGRLMATATQHSQWGAPVFIIAPTFSGGTYLTNLLNAHPDVGITYRANLVMFLRSVRTLSILEKGNTWTSGRTRLVGLFDQNNFADIPVCYLSCQQAFWQQFYTQRFPHKSILCHGDRLEWPQAINDLDLLFPNARVIFVVRDGRDRLAAIKNHYEKCKRRPAALPAPDIVAESEYWRDMNACILRRISRFPQAYTLRYDRLIDDPDREVAALLAFLTISEAPTVFDYIRSTHNVVLDYLGASSASIATGEYWKQRLSDVELGLTTPIMRDMLNELNCT